MSNKKNELDEMDQTFNKFLKIKERDFTYIPNYKLIFESRVALNHFNRRIIECNK